MYERKELAAASRLIQSAASGAKQVDLATSFRAQLSTAPLV